jgi:hypothetical protein
MSDESEDLEHLEEYVRDLEDEQELAELNLLRERLVKLGVKVPERRRLEEQFELWQLGQQVHELMVRLEANLFELWDIRDRLKALGVDMDAKPEGEPDAPVE